MIRTTRKILPLSLMLVLAGCSQMPNYEKPQTDLPQTIGEIQQAPGLVIPETEQAWWLQFDDATLQAMLDKALERNADFNIAQQRLFQARAALTQGRAEHWPSLQVQGGLGRQQTSDNAPQAPGAEFESYNLDGLISYEVDLWGRVRSNQLRLSAEYEAMQADTQALRLSLTSAVATSYFNLRALDQMVSIARNTVSSRQENLQLRQRQYELGRLTQLAVQQAEVELTRVEIELINLEQQRDVQRHALSLLVGDTPAQMVKASQAEAGNGGFTDTEIPALHSDLASELLMRRPDIQAAEQRLIAANANIGVARAALFPKLSLNGLIGVNSNSVDTLFDGNSTRWQAQAGLTAPIFNAGSLRAQVQISEAEQQIMLNQYQQTLRQAFAEALDALNMHKRSERQLDVQQRQVIALRSTLDLAQKRFDSGYSSYLEVLDAQRTLFDAEVAMVTTKRNYLNASIELYKALGGHWQG
ncbi:efflux transporter outer membrane subunit [Thiomicrospira pelophila]|uniref:efflux transporter outer membrane subunit n=1 Tax=Thiomicrospira pelophila TaxID=934 RepID=UPI00068DFFDE|nr:efflux transporter outer membrane subunit [Thiomicrospira pelophila]